ncbi:homoserine dehydrogenase [Acidianus sulfidivorans JP7]|uniref:Homoserine dehydrogenase n=1 Tax=Acidianus sulfidivorans JP7 TaxID=619593 RepID=A0A2U9INF9_9CREN|nr:homoserine dehydrogenase [Acidianus sulfidivorans]AWR97537.1 homoserine dehydrogenase [Acidianus sulfidivorans JP7]
MKILLMGFGNVGKAFRKLVNEKNRAKELENVRIVGIMNTKGLMLGDNEIFRVDKKVDVIQAIDETQPDVIVDTMSANYTNGEPSLSLYLEAIHRGINIITTNKAPLALKFSEIMKEAEKHNVKVMFQATVMSGTPSINLYRVIPGTKVLRIKGILNGTTNYILSRMYEGLDYDVALKEAQEKGYAERNPELDINGFDAAGKITILSNVYFGKNITIKDVKFEGIKNVNSELISKTKERGTKIKLIAYSDEKEVYVKPLEVEKNDPLYNVDGVLNALEIETDIQNITIIGPGAGPVNAAYGALADLILLIRKE